MAEVNLAIILPFFGSKIELEASIHTTIDEIVEVGIVNTLPPDKQKHKFEIFFKGKLLEPQRSLFELGIAKEAQPITLDCVTDRADTETAYIKANIRHQGQKITVEIDPHSLVMDLLVKSAKVFKIPLDNPQTRMHAFFKGKKLDNGQSLFLEGFQKTFSEDDFIDVFVEAIGG